MAATFIALLLLLAQLLATLEPTGAQIGLCSSMQQDCATLPAELTHLYSQKFFFMRLFDPNRLPLVALRGTNIKIMLGVPNNDLEQIGSESQAHANSWVHSNVPGDVHVRYIVVGNEVKPSDPFARFLVPAMRNIQNALDAAGRGSIKVSTALDWEGTIFKGESRALHDDLVQFLVSNNAPLLMQLACSRRALIF